MSEKKYHYEVFFNIIKTRYEVWKVNHYGRQIPPIIASYEDQNRAMRRVYWLEKNAQEKEHDAK